jgi:hypothetical protein
MHVERRPQRRLGDNVNENVNVNVCVKLAVIDSLTCYLKNTTRQTVTYCVEELQ